MKKYWNKFLELSERYQFFYVFFLLWNLSMMISDYKTHDYKWSLAQAFAAGYFLNVIIDNPTKRNKEQMKFIEKQLEFHEWVKGELDKRDEALKFYQEFDSSSKQEMMDI